VSILKSKLVDISANGEEASSDEEKAEMLNKFFTSVYARKRLDNIPEFSDHDFVTSLNDISFSADLVRGKLLNLEPHKAAGLDNIYNYSLEY